MAKQTDDAARDIIVESARIQLATFSAAVDLIKNWLEATQEYAEALNEELVNETDSGESTGTVVARLADLNREYLRKVAELPGMSAAHFNSFVEKGTSKRPKRSRSVRVKE